MQNDTTILGTIEPDVAERIVSRRDAIRQGATVSSTVALGLAMGSVPVALAVLSREARAQTSTVTEVLNFALMLEIFENEFYKAVLGTSASTAQNAAFATVRAQVPSSAVPGLQQIQKHEAAHVELLLASGASNVLNLDANSFDFTGARGSGNGPFARATTEVGFLLLTAQAAEDTGVRAYKGQAANLMSSDQVLETALRIHSVEARHAAKIRRLRRGTGASAVPWSGTVRGGGAAAAGSNISNPPAGAVAALELIYGPGSPAASFPSESNTTHAGVDVTGLSNLPSGVNAEEASEAFDEPLDRTTVRQIVQPFFKPDIP